MQLLSQIGSNSGWRHKLNLRLRIFVWQQATRWLSLGKRLLDLGLSITLLVFTAPLMACLYIFCPHHPRIQRILRLGKQARPFWEYSFTYASTSTMHRLGLHRLPTLINVLIGHMSFVGPRCVAPSDIDLSKNANRKRFDVRPGFVCLWWIRERANIDYGTETDADNDYVDIHSPLQDLGIAARAIPAALYGKSQNASDQIHILGLPIHNVNMDEILDWIANQLNDKNSAQLCFLNADCANIAWHNDDYFRLINKADLSLADGIGLKIAGRLLGRDIRQNINGTDLFPQLCDRLQNTHHSIYLLGGKPGVAQDVQKCINKHHPSINICGTHHGYFTPEQEPDVINQIANSGASLLLVALGAPRQDLWINQNLAQLNVPLAMGVGGLFDFYSGRIPRAPQWLRELCLEWIYRLIQEPKRMWKRYLLGNTIFIFRVLIEKCGWLPKRRQTFSKES